MAAILLLRRGTTPSTTLAEPYFNTEKSTLQIGNGSTAVTLAKLDSINTGSFNVSGNITASNATLTGNLSVAGNITFGGSLITLGNENTDNIVISGELSSSLIPNNDNSFDIGTSNKRYKNLFVVSASIDNVSLPGSGILSSSNETFVYFSSSVDSRFDYLEGTYSESVDFRLDKLEASSSLYDNAMSGSNRLYVSPQGSDTNDGKDPSTPFKTIKAAVESLGSAIASNSKRWTIIVGSGNYTEQNPIVVPPDVAIVGDTLRTVRLTAANPTKDYFHCHNGNYFYGLRFLNLKHPAFAFSFPCSTATSTISGGSVSTISVVHSMTGYTNGNNQDIGIVIEGPDASGSIATATANISGGVITQINVVNGGTNYTATEKPHISIPAPQSARPVIFTSPYVQNCSSITGPFNTSGNQIFASLPYSETALNVDEQGAGGGIRIDGNLVSGSSPLESFVADAFTQVNQGGPGHLVINKGYAQFVSCFTTFCTYGFKVVNGGFANVSNSVIDFGKYGLISKTYYPTSYNTATGNENKYSSVSGFEITQDGAGYTGSVAGVTISAPNIGGGTQATAEAVVSILGTISSVYIINSGSGYTSVPTVTIDSPTGAGAVQATADAIISGVTQMKMLLADTTQSVEISSNMILNGVDYLVTNVETGSSVSEKLITTYPNPPQIQNGDSIYFHKLSNISTGGMVMEYVGSGVTFNALPKYGGVPKRNREIIQIAPGRIFYSTVDNIGNLKIGEYFEVNQLTGEVTIDASNFNLSGINQIGPFRRNGISVGKVLREVSDSVTLINSQGEVGSDTVPTQYAVKEYVSNVSASFNSSFEFVNDKINDLESYTASNDLDITELFTTASDHEDRIDSLENVDINYGQRLTYLELDSSSQDNRLDNLEIISGSHNTRLNNLELFSSSEESKNSTLATYTGSVDNHISIINLYTQSVDSKFNSIQNFTSSAANAIYHLNQYSQSLRNAIDVDGQNLTVFGDLTVQGTTTTLNTTELVIEDKVLSLASGSTTSAQADGAGLHISGANVSILWKHDESLLQTNAKVSSSVGFKGDGSELTNIQYGNLSLGGTGLVSGSAQVTASLDLRYLLIEGDSVVSGSSQIDLTETTNYVSGIKDRLNAENVVSGSTQITNGSNLLSSSNENFEQFSSSVDFRLDTLQLFTSSQESKNSTLATYTGSVDGKFLSLQNWSSSIDSKFSTLSTYTSSVDSDLNKLHLYTQSNDSNVNNLFNTASQYYSFSSSIDTIIKNKLNVDGIVSSSSDSPTIDFSISNGVLSANVIGGIVSSSNQLTQSLDLLYEESGSVAALVGIRVTSGSLGSAAWYNVSASISDGNPSTLGTAKAIKDYIDDQFIIVGAGDITEVIAGNGISGGGLSGSVTMSLDTGSSHFSNGVLSSITSFSSSVDTRLDGLEAFSTSLDTSFVTQNELANATGSLIDSIATKLNTGSYNSDSQSFDSRIDAIELFSTSLDNTFVTQTELATATGSLINSIATKLNTGSYNTDSASFDTRLDILELYSSSNFVPTASFATSTTQVDVYVKNMSGAQINKGTVVKISGAVGDNPLIVTASYSNELGSANTLGITTTNIPNGGFGWVISEGVLLGVNTDGFNVGDLIYLGATGSFTNTEPTAPLHGVRLGQVLRVNQNNGSLYVRIDNGEELKELHNVIDTSTNSSYGDVLIKSGSVWVNNSTFSSSIDSTFVNLNEFSSSINTTIKNKLNSDSVLSGSLSTLTGGSGIVSSSNQVTSSLDTRYVNLSGSQTITGTKTFTDIVVNGTGSFARIESVTSQATIIGSSFVVVNTNTPTQRYAGLTVYDSGSTLSTASLFFDGQLNDWNYEYSSSAGIDYATVLFAPSYGTKGSPTYPTSNKIQKGTGNHHLADSNITDNGTTITLGSNVVITGTLSANGIVSGSTFTSPSQGTLRATINGAQTDVDLGLQTTDEVQFAKVGVGGAADATYELKVTGDIGATGDIVAYISSDRRLKDEITPISNPIEKINQIGGYSFVWNEHKQNIYKGKDYGVIAQEIESVLPELVENRDNGYKAVKYDRLVSLLIEGIKELSKEVNELKSKLEK